MWFVVKWRKKGGGKTVSNATPGVFFTTYITAPSSEFTVDIFQANTLATFNLFDIESRNDVKSLEWNLRQDCYYRYSNQSVAKQGQTTVDNSGRYRVGDVIVISVKYDSKTLIGSTFTDKNNPPDVTVLQFFDWRVDHANFRFSTCNNCKTSRKITNKWCLKCRLRSLSSSFQDKLTIKYKFGVSDEIEVFNSQERRCFLTDYQ
jgi:hypothetical protein